MLFDGLRRQRARLSSANSDFSHKSTFSQSCQYVAHDRTADAEMVAQLVFDDTELTKHDASRNIVLNFIVDTLPGRTALQRLVDVLGNDERRAS